MKPLRHERFIDWTGNERPIQEQLLYGNVQRFRGGLLFKAHGLLYHSTLGLRVIKKKKKERTNTSKDSSRTSRADVYYYQDGHHVCTPIEAFLVKLVDFEPTRHRSDSQGQILALA